MAVLYGTSANLVFNTNPPTKVAPSRHGGRLRVLADDVTFATQTTSDTIIIGGGRLPIGAQVQYVTITTDTSTGAATLALGITGSVAKYKAAGAVTTVNVPQIFGVTAALLTPITTEEQLFFTIAAASLPASGRMVVAVYYTID